MSKDSSSVRPPTTRRLAKVLLSIVVIAIVVMFVATGPRRGAYIRMNGVGYEAGTPMRAYLMSADDDSGAQFAVRDAQGNTLSSALVGPEAGKWGRYFVYPVDFSIAPQGSYTIRVNGRHPASSPAFQVDQPDRLYAGPVANALSFYQAQRDGTDFVPSALRTAPAHLNDKNSLIYQTPQFDDDGHIKGDLRPAQGSVDVSGGWFDAGDYLKFVHTTSYVEALMLMGVRDFPSQMGQAATSNFTAEAKFGIEWLLRMWDDNSLTLYYQVGIGSGNSSFEDDHSIWRLPQADDTMGGTDPRFRYIRNRPVFIGSAVGSSITPNLAGRLAAVFALCSSVFKTQNSRFADRCLLSAEHIYDLANTAPVGELLTVAPHDFYGEAEWRDDMELGAIELYLALRKVPLPEGLPHKDPTFYLQAASKWASAYLQSQKEPPSAFDVADVGAIAHVELVRVMDQSHQMNLTVTRDQLLGDLQAKLDRAVRQSNSDPFGFGMRWQQEDTASHGSALAVMASQYDYLTHSTKYEKYGKRWADNILGSNAWGASLIVADGSEFPLCIHHQVANLAGSHNGQPPVLAGAVVEGPNGEPGSSWFSSAADWLVLKFPRLNSVQGMSPCPADATDRFAPFNGNGARFKDSYTAYSTSEPAIDLTAPSFLMFSWRMAGAPSPLE